MAVEPDHLAQTEILFLKLEEISHCSPCYREFLNERNRFLEIRTGRVAQARALSLFGVSCDWIADVDCPDDFEEPLILLVARDIHWLLGFDGFLKITRRQQMKVPVNARMAGTNPKKHPERLGEPAEPAEVQVR
jgi:hypothetical protein